MGTAPAIVAPMLLASLTWAQGGADAVVNGDFARLTDEGLPADFSYWVDAGEVGAEMVDDPGGRYLRLSFGDLEDNARLLQGLDLPDASYHRASFEVRTIARGAVPPQVGLRVAFETPIGKWRVWAHNDPTLDGQWHTVAIDFLVPNEASGGNIKFHLGQNGEPGEIHLRTIRVVELPLTDYQREHAHVTAEGHTYYPKQPAPPPARPELPQAALDRGFFWWTPADGDGATPWDGFQRLPVDAAPGTMLSVAGGASASTVIVIEAARDLPDLRIEVPEPFVAQGQFEVRTLRVWRQRDGHRSGFYHDVPELLEPLPARVDLAAGERLQLFVTFVAEAGAPLGDLVTGLRARVGEAEPVLIPIEVVLQPFDLAPSPADVVWGLYPDPGRWQAWTDEQFMAELRWLRACGINSLLLYMPFDALNPYEPLTDDNVEAALAGWRAALERWGDRYMTAFLAAGFGSHLVANVQGMDVNLARIMGVEVIGADGAYNPKLLEYNRRFLQVLEDLRRERGWPEFTWHVIDEPGSGRNVVATAEFELIQAMGLRGFTTANAPMILRDFADLTDDFCAGHAVFPTREDAERAHDWLAHRTDANLWHYGAAGTYNDQEGAMAPNRYGAGFLTWIYGATGEFFWTFQRLSGDPWDDFDGPRTKDFCLAYPAPGGGASLSTLQWEGICQGIVDYRHLAMLEGLVAAARAAGGVEAEKAARIAGELDRLRDTLWGLEEPPGNRMLDDWRARLAGWIMELRAAG